MKRIIPFVFISFLTLTSYAQNLPAQAIPSLKAEEAAQLGVSM